MNKKTVRDVNVKGKKVLLRADFNVPLTPDGKVADDRRIRATLPTIKALLDAGAAVIIMTHVGRPSGDPQKDKKLSTEVIAERLGDLLNKTVQIAGEVVGDRVQRQAENLKPGNILVLENLRFHPGEKRRDVEFAKQLASYADIYVNDAFGTAHRADASTVTVPQQFAPGCRVAGLLMERELEILDRLLTDPARPMIAVLGGKKVSDKVQVIENLIPRADRILIGGAMSYSFMRAAGRATGNSFTEEEAIETAKRLAESAGAKIELPADHVVASELAAEVSTQVVEGNIPDGMVSGDIGPKTIEHYKQAIAAAKTVVWNGPMGVFELPPFSQGTRAVAEAMAESDATTVVGGGETAEAADKFGVSDKLTHVSTGGGAFLEYLAGVEFETLEVLDDRD